MKQITATNIIVGPARLSYLAAFKPRHNDLRGEDEYSVVLLIPKAPSQFCQAPKAELEGVAKAITAAAQEKFKEIPKVLDRPLKDGDKEFNGEGEAKYPGYWFLGARSSVEYPPVLIGGDQNPVVDGWVSGDWGKVQVNLFGYDFKGKKGVGASLRAIQFLYHDEPFGQTADPATVARQFDPVEDADSGATHSVAAAAQSGPDEYDPFQD